MHIPPTCESWAKQMASGVNGEPQILENVRKESCVPHLEKRFFDLVATEPTPTNPVEAVLLSANVVFRNESEFCLQGNAVAADSFQLLFRVQKVRTLYNCLPDDFRRAKGLSKATVANLTNEEITAILANFTESVSWGGKSSVVWVANYDQLEPLRTNLRLVINRLGLLGWDGETKCLLLLVPRSEVGGALRVPRVFEGIDSRQFALVVSCSETHGLTQPLDSATHSGLNEAVCFKSPVKSAEFSMQNL